MADEYLTSIGFSAERKDAIINIIEEAQLDVENTNDLSRILEDALTMDWGKPKSKGKVKRLYEEFLLTGSISYGKSTWYDTVLTYLREHEFKTNYGKSQLEEGKLALIKKVEKEKKELDRNESTILKKVISQRMRKMLDRLKKMNSVDMSLDLCWCSYFYLLASGRR